MRPLIAFWKAKLQDNKWLMGRENIEMVKQTILALKELQKLRATSKVQREADIVRTVKELSGVREGGGK